MRVPRRSRACVFWRFRPSLVKRIQTFHAFVTLVPNHPLEHLWNLGGYWTPHERTRSLSAEEVGAILAESNDYRLVEAKTGAELRWYQRGDYGVWYHYADRRMRKGVGRPGELAYVASEWIDPDTGDRAILPSTRAMPYMTEVYYLGPQDVAREAQFTAVAEAAGGRLDFREGPSADSAAICLTYDFEALTQAESVAEKLRRSGVHVEGPSDYGP